MSQENEFLFVYGTLLRQSQSPMSKMLSSKSSYIGKGHVYGTLYDIGDYPGAVLSENKKSKIYGEVFRLKDFSLIKSLDKYEECSENDEFPHEYKRVKISVNLDSGKKVSAWIYIFNLPTDSYSKIESGDYMSYLGLVLS